MKALRKCVCVAVQLVVAAALLLQQCPVQAIALGLEQGSSYVEIPSSEERADAAEDSSDATSDGGRLNEASPTSPGKDEAEAASGAIGAASADNAKQNVQGDSDDINSGSDVPAPTSDEELVWNRLGTLEWSKDANKNVFLRPADGEKSGSYEREILASQLFGYDIKSFSVQGRVAVTSIIFSRCTEMTSANLSGLTVVGASMRGMFMYCDSLNNVSFVGAEAPTVEDVSLLFANCSSLKSIDFEGVTFPKVKDMDWMFYGCRNLETADLKAFDSVLIDRLGLIHSFDGCSSLRAVKLPNLDSSKAASLEYIPCP